MEQALLQKIEQLRGELMELVEQGYNLQNAMVLEKSQELDVLLADCLEEQWQTICQQRDNGCKSSVEMLQ